MNTLDAMGPRRRISPDSGVPELIDAEGFEDEYLVEQEQKKKSETANAEEAQTQQTENTVAPGESELWHTIEKWIEALPETTETQKAMKQKLNEELTWIMENTALRGLGEIVFGHCDLLSGNVIVLPKKAKRSGFCPADIGEETDTQVTFIDYE